MLPLAAPIAGLCHQKWSSKDIIDLVNMPMLFLSGGQDQLVPPQHMKQLYERSKLRQPDAVRKWRMFPKGDHNDTVCQPGYMQEILDFVEEVAKGVEEK